jgi:MFS family permease
MIRTVRQVLTSASLPITAKLSDYVGRPFVIWMTVFFWIIGTAITATSHSLGQYIPGFLLYTLGHVAGNSKAKSRCTANNQFSATPSPSTPVRFATASS